MSQRERSFLKAAFHGVLAEELTADFPRVPADERARLDAALHAIEGLAPRDAASDPEPDGVFPGGWLPALAEGGVLGARIPEDLGGVGLGRLADARLHEALGAFDPGLAVSVGAHAGLAVTALMRAGTEAQRRRYLPVLARGERVAGFALTEPGMGSDAAGTQTLAELSEDGGGYRLRGEKLWVTNGGVGDLFVVFARTTRPDAEAKPALTAFLVERWPGVEAGPELPKVGVRGASTTALRLDVRAPADALLGPLGRGFQLAVETLNEGRIQVGARCLGVSKRALARATERAAKREAFGRPLAGFQMIQERLARLAARIYALESMVTLTAGLADAGMPDYSLESAALKVFASETATAATDVASRIAAGTGYVRGAGWDRALRDARADLLLEGTNEVMRAFIALSGMRSPGARMEAVERAMREPIKGFGVLSDFALSRARAVLGRERLTVAHPLLKREAVILEESVGALGSAADRLLRRHGAGIAEEQILLGRVADAAIEVWALAATIARASSALRAHGENAAATDLLLASAFAEGAGRSIRSNLGRLDDDGDRVLTHLAGALGETGGALPPLP